jgi:hypothetical protein
MLGNAPSPPGVTTWHLLNVVACLAFGAFGEINGGLGEEQLTMDISSPHVSRAGAALKYLVIAPSQLRRYCGSTADGVRSRSSG